MTISQVHVSVPLKATGTAYLWWFFFGGLGAHKFYLGRPGLGVLYACTLGVFYLGVLYDLFTLPWQVREANEKLLADARGLTGEPPSSNWRSAPDERDAASPLNDPDALIAKYLRADVPVARNVASTSAPVTRASFGKKRTA